MSDKQQVNPSQKDEKSSPLSGLSLNDFQKGIQEAYSNYIKELRDIGIDAQKNSHQAYWDISRTLQSQLESSKDQAQYGEAYCKAAQSFQEAISQQDYNQRGVKAYQTYLRAIQEAWANLDIENVNFSEPKHGR